MPTNPEVIRPDQALAAMQIGLLLRRIEHDSFEVWLASLLDEPNADEYFQKLEGALLALSYRFNDFEARKISELGRQSSDWFSAAFNIRGDWILAKQAFDRDGFREYVLNDAEVQWIQERQRNRLIELRTIVNNIIGNDLRISAWFEIGDNLGHTICRFMRGELSIPLSAFECNQLRSGVKKLPLHLQRRVQPFFPDPNREGYDLAAELWETYQGLCGIVLKLSPMVIPVWDGRTIRFQGKEYSIKAQHNSVIIPILTAFENQGWPQYITHSLDFDDVKQALFKFNKAGVIRLSQSGDQVRWYDPE